MKDEKDVKRKCGKSEEEKGVMRRIRRRESNEWT